MDDDWRRQASCKGLTPFFFPEHGGSARFTDLAKGLCSICPVSQQCLDYALENFDHRTDFGIWGGTNAPERRVLRKQSA